MKAIQRQDTGLNRENNEDSVMMDLEAGIFILADGMGGHQAGEVASGIAVRESHEHLRAEMPSKGEKDAVTQALVAALFKAHDAIKAKGAADVGLRGMGTTLTQMVVRDGTAYLCHVGDSRAYLMRENLRQITHDQTQGDYLVEHRIMTRDQVPPQKWHTLAQAVGLSERIVPEICHVDLQSGDLLLLCSDGLTDMLSDSEIEDTIRTSADDLDHATQILIDAANSRGGLDNISVILVKC